MSRIRKFPENVYIVFRGFWGNNNVPTYTIDTVFDNIKSARARAKELRECPPINFATKICKQELHTLYIYESKRKRISNSNRRKKTAK